MKPASPKLHLPATWRTLIFHVFRSLLPPRHLPEKQTLGSAATPGLRGSLFLPRLQEASSYSKKSGSFGGASWGLCEGNSPSPPQFSLPVSPVACLQFPGGEERVWKKVWEEATWPETRPVLPLSGRCPQPSPPLNVHLALGS